MISPQEHFADYLIKLAIQIHKGEVEISHMEQRNNFEEFSIDGYTMKFHPTGEKELTIVYHGVLYK